MSRPFAYYTVTTLATLRTVRQPTCTVIYIDQDSSGRDQTLAQLQQYAIDAVGVGTATEARALLRAHRFDVLLVDLTPPAESAQALVHEMAARATIGIIATSSLTDETERVLALENGADEFLVRPFGTRALVAHVRAVCRRLQVRSHGPRRRIAQFGDWEVDLSSHRATRGDRVVGFTGGELAILRVLLEGPRRVFSRGELLASTRHDEAEVFDRTIDVLISRLRHKIESDPVRPTYIQTVRGEGYCFDQDVVWTSEA
jgi:two-component system OmpR family response regulator